MDRLAHALRLAALGFLIAPLRPGTKLPYGGEIWSDIHTTDETTIRGWFAMRPGMNYSVCPGERGVIIDLDLDEKKGKNGVVALEALDAENFEDAITGNTFTVKTPRGGLHLYLSTPHPISNRDGGFPLGIDVRGRGGYVVGPACTTEATPDGSTATGEYVVWVDTAVAPAPNWILTRLDVARERDANAAEAIGEEDTETAITSVRTIIREQTSWPIEGEGGDAATYQFIALLRNYGAVTPDKMFELLNEEYEDAEGWMASWNDRCAPSWSDTDLNRKIENAYNYATSAAGSKGGLLESLDMIGVEYLDRVDPQLKKQQEGTKSKLDAMYFPGDSLTARTCRREYVIDQWMLSHGMTQLLAFRSTGKSIVMIDLCLRIACDMDWFDTKVAKGWAVVYCCGEDDEGMQAQMDAWVIDNGIHPKDNRFIVMTGVPDLNNKDECFAWITFLKSKLQGNRAVFAVDTWQRATSNASQNDDQHMNAATDMADFIADQLGGPAFIAFHPPKGNTETISGSMLIENKGSAIWKMSADAIVKKLVVDRIKGKGRGNFLKFFFNETELPYKDQWGKPSTAIIVAKAGGIDGDSPALKSKNVEAKANWAQLVLDMMVEAEKEAAPPTFNKGDIANRLIAFKSTNDAHPSYRALHRIGEHVPKDYRTMLARLGEVFTPGGPMVPCTDGYNGVYVEGTSKGNGPQKYIRTDTKSYYELHPDKKPTPDIIPMVGDEDVPTDAIQF